MSDLSEADETLLAVLCQENGWVEIRSLSRVCDMTEQACWDALPGLVASGLVRLRESEPALNPGAAALTQGGEQAARALAVLPTDGPVPEFAIGLDDLQRAALDAVTERQLRISGTWSKRSEIRAVVRKRLPETDIATATAAIDGLAKSGHLQSAGGAQEPQHQVTLRGLLASAWGLNALGIIGQVLDLLRTSHDADPAFPRYSWRSLRTSAHQPYKAFNLVYIAIVLSRLGHGVFEDHGEHWWAVPPELDVLVEHKTATDYVRHCLGPVEPVAAPVAASSPSVVSPAAVPPDGRPVPGHSAALHADVEVAAALDRISPDFAACYRQALRDLDDRGRESFVGVVAEMREVLTAVLHELAPNEQVEAQPWFKQEPNTHGPTRAQRVRHIMSTRSSSKSSVAVEAITELDQRLPHLAKELYARASRGTHLAPTDRRELLTLLGYWQSLLRDLLLG